MRCRSDFSPRGNSLINSGSGAASPGQLACSCSRVFWTCAGFSVPAAVVQKIREVFGRDPSPAEVVSTIIADVRSEGDAAIRRYTEAIDGRRILFLLGFQ